MAKGIVTIESARKRKFNEARKAIKELRACIDRKAYFKAQNMIRGLDHFIYCQLDLLTSEQVVELRTQLNEQYKRIPTGAGVKTKKVSKRDAQKQAWVEFLYCNNTYQGPAS